MGEKPGRTSSIRPLSSKASFFIRKPPVQRPQETNNSVDSLKQQTEISSQESLQKKFKHGDGGDLAGKSKDVQEYVVEEDKPQIEFINLDSINSDDSPAVNHATRAKPANYPSVDLTQEAKEPREDEKDDDFFKNLSPEVQAMYRQTQISLADKKTEDAVKATYKIRFKVENRTKDERFSETTIPLAIKNDEPFRNLILQSARFVGIAPSHLELCSAEGGRVPPTLSPEQCRLIGDNTLLHLLDRKGLEQRNLRLSKEQKERIERSKNEELLEPNFESQSDQSIPESVISLQIRPRNGKITQITVDPNKPLIGQIFEKLHVQTGRVSFDGKLLTDSVTALGLSLENDDLVDFI